MSNVISLLFLKKTVLILHLPDSTQTWFRMTHSEDVDPSLEDGFGLQPRCSIDPPWSLSRQGCLARQWFQDLCLEFLEPSNRCPLHSTQVCTSSINDKLLLSPRAANNKTAEMIKKIQSMPRFMTYKSRFYLRVTFHHFKNKIVFKAI